MSKRNRTVVVVAVSDTHCNSTVGVNPAVVELKDGEWRAKRPNLWRLERWRELWQWALDLKRRHRALLYVVANGDLVDDPYHPTTKTITKGKDAILALAVEVWEPVRKIADQMFVVGGTDAHSGVDHWMEELLARDLDCTPDKARKCHAWDHLKLEAGGVTFDICHHPETAGYMAHTEKGAALRQSNQIMQRYAMAGEVVPVVALRGHVHFFADSGLGTRPRTFFLWPWQNSAETTYGKRKGKGYFVRPHGALAFICKDGEYTLDFKTFKPRGRGMWIK